MRLEADEAIAESSRARLYILLRGALSVATDTRTGMADGTISKILPGESVGEQSVLDEEANLATSRAGTDEVLVIEADLVWQLIDESNVLARNLLRLLSFRIRAANAQLRRRQKLGEFYRQLSMIDGLTDLYNRAWLNDLLPTMVATAHGSNAPLSLIMIDLDHFKRFNDSHGHLAGDEALRAAAPVLSGALRPTDFAVRYGGEEMMVLLPDTSDKVACPWPSACANACGRPRCSATCACRCRTSRPRSAWPALQPQQDEHELIAHADAALYRAKENGRNRGQRRQAEAHSASGPAVFGAAGWWAAMKSA
jgi:diguanylate cyclase (GGDEF)-like protein